MSLIIKIYISQSFMWSEMVHKTVGKESGKLSVDPVTGRSVKCLLW